MYPLQYLNFVPELSVKKKERIVLLWQYSCLGSASFTPDEVIAPFTSNE